MFVTVKGLLICLGMAAFCAVPGAVQERGKASRPPATLESLQAEVEALKAPKVAWREIAWDSCLLDGLKKSRAQHKPALLWVFIDRPVDDARC